MLPSILFHKAVVFHSNQSAHMPSFVEPACVTAAAPSMCLQHFLQWMEHKHRLHFSPFQEHSAESIGLCRVTDYRREDV